MTKTKKLRYWLNIQIWKPNPSKSELSQQASPGAWLQWRDYSFPTQTELDHWLNQPTDAGLKRVSRREYYEKTRTTDGNYLFKLSQQRR